MAELKTKPNDRNVNELINSIENTEKIQDCHVLIEIMKEITKSEPKIWGDSIVGFGDYHYKYKSGREGDWFFTGFSPRKQNISVYIMTYLEHFDELLGKLGKFKKGKSCLYIKKLRDVDIEVLKELIRLSVELLQVKK